MVESECPATGGESLQERLKSFDPNQHGGEFPTKVDESFQVPQDMPVQERRLFEDDAQT